MKIKVPMKKRSYPPSDIEVPMKKRSYPPSDIEVPMKCRSSIKARGCNQGFTMNHLSNYTLPEGILNHYQLNPNHRLPEDVLFYQILVRLSTKTLVRFRSVCKGWDLVTRDPQFVRKHLDQQHHRLLGLSHNGVFSVDYETGAGLEWFSLPAISSYKLPQLLGSCNGLVGISIHCGNSHHNRKLLYLCNLSSRESKLIPEPDPYIDSNEPLGFAYDSSDEDYKFVRVINTWRMDMYSLRSNSWRNIKHDTDNDSDYKCFRGDEYQVVGVNGNIYRMGFKGSDNGYINDTVTIGLRLSDCNMTYLKLPFEMLLPNDITNPPEISERHIVGLGSFLAACKFTPPGTFVLWALKESEKNEERKWEKLMSLRYPVLYLKFISIQPVRFTKDGKLIFLSVEKTLGKKIHEFWAYDPKKKRMKRFVRVYARSGNLTRIPHLETLASPNMFGSSNI